MHRTEELGKEQSKLESCCSAPLYSSILIFRLPRIHTVLSTCSVSNKSIKLSLRPGIAPIRLNLVFLIYSTYS